MAGKFVDDDIQHIESDIEKIQVKPSMYISYLGERGALHLCYELINNAIDECTNANSPGDTITILLDEAENSISVSDNGRGLDPNKMEIICTTLQSGSKFNRDGSGGASAGENGVGLTCCNALSSRFEIIMTRYGERYKIAFSEGNLVEPLSSTKIKSTDKHGTTFIISPSKRYMGSCKINADNLTAWLDKIIYLVPRGVTVNLAIKKKGRESLINRKLQNKNGLYDYIKKLCKKPSVDPIHILTTSTLTETVHDKQVNRFMGLEMAFTYDQEGVEFFADSFCNFVNTVDNGVHVDAVKQAIVHHFTKLTRDNLSERESKKLDIVPSDVTQGLVMTVYLSTDYPPMFTGQTKEKVGSNELFKPVRDMTFKSLVDYFKTNPKDAKKIIDRVKLNAKARIESTKVRNSVIRGEQANFYEHMLENFAPANNKGKNQYKELFIIEGKSARGNASTGRFDRNTQAVYSIRGVPLNAYGTKLDKVLKNEEMNVLIQILGCNIGARFNINKLKYNRIIIMADSDSDGFNITSLLCAFFIYHMPELVKQGYIYKAVSPLYELKNKKRFVLNKQEYAEVFEKEIRRNVVVYDADNNRMTDKSLQKLLMDARDYMDELERVSNRLSIDKGILEYFIIHRNDKDFTKKFSKAFPEIEIDDQGVMHGVHQGKYQILIMDNSFEKRIASLNEFINNLYKGRMYYTVQERSGNDFIDIGKMSISQFITMVNKFQPVIKTRFKGLGELDAADLRETSMDPNNRILIQMTSKDIEKELEVFDILHGNDSDARKLMMNHFKIKREDLDN